MKFSFDLAGALSFCYFLRLKWTRMRRGRTAIAELFVIFDFSLSFVGECKANIFPSSSLLLLFIFPLVCRCCWPHSADDAIRNMPHWVSNSIFCSEQIMNPHKWAEEEQQKPINFPVGSACLTLSFSINRGNAIKLYYSRISSRGMHLKWAAVSSSILNLGIDIGGFEGFEKPDVTRFYWLWTASNWFLFRRARERGN